MATGDEFEELGRSIIARYTEAARCAEGLFGYPTGGEGARGLGYDPDLIDGAPRDLLESYCGVGNPFSLGPIVRGETVLDIGCGAGFDLFCAGRMAGNGGRAVGIDLTPAMAAKAESGLRRTQKDNVFVVNGKAEKLPFKTFVFDVVISNGTLNLSPEKARALSEAHRVLKPGGRLQFADIVLRGDPPEVRPSAEAWAD